jgi:hypothetical protein
MDSLIAEVAKLNFVKIVQKVVQNAKLKLPAQSANNDA